MKDAIVVVVEESDPFDVFGDDDDENEQETKDDPDQAAIQILRDPENGVLVFHGGTEKALLLFVKNNISNEQFKWSPLLKKLSLLIDLIDRFCYERHWMMNIGPEKGRTLETFLDECIQVHLQSHTNGINNTFTFVELGTYCGYSCLRYLHRILQHLSVGQFHIFTVDVEMETISIAQEFVTMVGLQDCVTFVHLTNTNETNPLSNKLLKGMKEQLQVDHIPRIDFLFIDHDKKGYLRDLQQLELNGFIQKGTYVAADNVLFHGIDDYRNYIQKLTEQAIVSSHLVEGSLEYVNDKTLEQEEHLSEVRDGIELTIYKQNPMVFHSRIHP